ncbi:MAG: DUF5916 domain-containing protein [Candidatus Neomarinimicrobiota bacterium]
MKAIKTLFLMLLVANLTGGKLEDMDLEMPQSVNALRINTVSIHVDGFLDDPAWQQEERASDFIQRDPLEGEAATERTEFLVLYDDEYVYIGLKAYDSEPNGIISILSRRDEQTPSDWISVSLDSYDDHRTAFEFWLNPQGVKRDLRRYDDENLDVNWDAIWEGNSAIEEDGWSAEFKIPFRELRFSNGGDHSWGIQVYRHISRKNEDDFWAFWPKDESGWVRHYGRLDNLVDIPRQRRVYFAPYTTGQYATARDYRTPVHPEMYDLGSNLGADLKLGITNNLTLDLTLNPDFGQVEADPAELNISAFESFFPEQRPFFVEGGNIYQFPLGIGDNPMGNNSLFYTRRIGRSPQHGPSTEEGYVDIPMATTILGAGKLSGKTSSGWSIGALEAVTSEEHATIEYVDSPSEKEKVEPLTNYFVTRVQKDFREGKTTIGSIVTATNRQLDDPNLMYLHRDAYSSGFDFSHLFSDDTYQFSTTIGITSVRGTSEAILNTQLSPNHRFQRPGAPHLDVDSTATRLSGFAGNIVLGKFKGERWRGAMGGWFYSPGFDANDLGYNRNVDNSTQFIWVQYREDDPGKFIRRWTLNFNAWTGFTFAWFDELTDRGGNVNGNLTFMNYWSINGGIGVQGKGLNTTGLWGGPAMTEDPGRNIWFSVGSDYRKTLSAGANTSMGGSPESGVRYQNVSARFTWRPANYFSLTASSGLSNMHDTWSTWSDYEPIADVQSGEEHYVMAMLNRNTVSATVRFDVALSPTLTIQYYGSPFLTTGAYTDDKLVLEGKYQAKRFEDRFHVFTDVERDFDEDPYTYDTDNDGVANFELWNRDFNYKQFNSNLVIRWEYQTGSAIYLVWAQNMSDSVENGEFDVGRDLRNLFKASAEHVFLIKASYLVNI